MPEPLAFKSGKDLGEETRADDEDTVTCEACGAVESDERAYDPRAGRSNRQFARTACAGRPCSTMQRAAMRSRHE